MSDVTISDDLVLHFELTVAETNTILQALGNEAYVQVAGLIDNIKTQAAPQVSKTPVEPPKE